MGILYSTLVVVSFTTLNPPLSVEFNLYGNSQERCEEVKWNITSELELDGYVVCASDCKVVRNATKNLEDGS